MSTFAKVILSGSTNGKGIKVVATATTGTTIHTAVTGTSSWDEIWLYCFNSDTQRGKLTIEWGETTVPNGNIINYVEANNGLMLVVPGLVLQNSLVVTAFASVANKMVIHGFVNRIT
jgi:hypothetical protein